MDNRLIYPGVTLAYQHISRLVSFSFQLSLFAGGGATAKDMRALAVGKKLFTPLQ